MATVTSEEAQATLVELIHQLQPAEEIINTEHHQPVARLVPIAPMPARKSRQPGTLKGTITDMAPDCNAPLTDFQEYME